MAIEETTDEEVTPEMIEAGHREEAVRIYRVKRAIAPEPKTDEAVITEKMWLAGLAEARRAGMDPVFTYCDYQHLKTWLSAAYRAMRLAECADEK